VRLKHAKLLKIGESFSGIVLSSEAQAVISPLDKQLIEKTGIAGINCSWNR
jgi:ribosome biogenesis protein Tsr3